MNILFRASVVILLALLAACGGAPPAPSLPPPGPAPRPLVDPAPPMTFPPLSGPSRTFLFYRDVASYRVSDLTRQSRVILFDNGAFALQYPPNQYGTGVFRGAYQDAGGLLMFLFEGQGRTVGTPWNDATATLESDLLTLTYSERMQHSDFENAVYMLIPPG